MQKQWENYILLPLYRHKINSHSILVIYKYIDNSSNIYI